MQRLWLFGILALLVLAGCATDDDPATVYVTGSDAIHVLYPAAGETLRVQYRWQEYPEAVELDVCPWMYIADTTFLAEVRADVPGGVYCAQIYARGSGQDVYSPSGARVYPTGNSFTVPFVDVRDMLPYFYDREPLSGSLCIGIVCGDESFLLGPSIPFTLVREADSLLPGPPAIPDRVSLGTIDWYPERLLLEWCNSTAGIMENMAYFRCDYDGVTQSMIRWQSQIAELSYFLPLTRYTAWVTATNSLGESAPSDTVSFITGEPLLPVGVTATITSPPLVSLYWQLRRVPDSLYVQRRETATDWTPLATFASARYGYTDSTALSGSDYYYRVGIGFPTGTWWSAESDVVHIP